MVHIMELDYESCGVQGPLACCVNTAICSGITYPLNDQCHGTMLIIPSLLVWWAYSSYGTMFPLTNQMVFVINAWHHLGTMIAVIVISILRSIYHASLAEIDFTVTGGSESSDTLCWPHSQLNQWHMFQFSIISPSRYMFLLLLKYPSIFIWKWILTRPSFSFFYVFNFAVASFGFMS